MLFPDVTYLTALQRVKLEEEADAIEHFQRCFSSSAGELSTHRVLRV